MENISSVLLKPRTVELRKSIVPEVGPEDVCVQVQVTGLCGSDLHSYTHGGVGKMRTVEDTIILGHESAGIITEVGSKVTNVVVGDRVAIEPTMYCKQCTNCKLGKTNLCRNARQAALHPTQGTLSKYYVCESEYVIKIPDSISWAEAGCIQPLAVNINLARRAKFAPNQTIAVFGCGPLGSLVMATAKAYGVTKIIGFDIVQRRIDFAREHWADYVSLPHPRAEGQDFAEWALEYKAAALEAAGLDSWGVDTVIEASGDESCVHAGLAFLRPGGTFIQAGLGKPVSDFPTLQIVSKQIDFLGTVRYTPGCFETAIELIASGRVNVKPMVSASFPLTRSHEALEAVRLATELKVIILNQE